MVVTALRVRLFGAVCTWQPASLHAHYMLHFLALPLVSLSLVFPYAACSRRATWCSQATWSLLSATSGRRTRTLCALLRSGACRAIERVWHQSDFSLSCNCGIGQNRCPAAGRQLGVTAAAAHGCWQVNDDMVSGRVPAWQLVGSRGLQPQKQFIDGCFVIYMLFYRLASYVSCRPCVCPAETQLNSGRCRPVGQLLPTVCQEWALYPNKLK